MNNKDGATVICVYSFHQIMKQSGVELFGCLSNCLHRRVHPKRTSERVQRAVPIAQEAMTKTPLSKFSFGEAVTLFVILFSGQTAVLSFKIFQCVTCLCFIPLGMSVYW